MDNVRPRHRIEYTRNKHSRAVCRGDTIVIRLARNLSKPEQERHIHNLLRRMTRIVLREQTKTVIDPFRPLLRGEERCTVTLASGRCDTFVLKPGRSNRAEHTEDGWRITIAPGLRQRALHRFLWRILAQEEHKHVHDLVERINRETLQVQLHGVRLRFATSQWGSCSRTGSITVNTALLFLPMDLLQYVIVHELAHRTIANHSAAYWRLVQSAMPDYERAYQALQQYRLPHV